MTHPALAECLPQPQRERTASSRLALLLCKQARFMTPKKSPYTLDDWWDEQFRLREQYRDPGFDNPDGWGIFGRILFFGVWGIGGWIAMLLF